MRRFWWENDQEKLKWKTGTDGKIVIQQNLKKQDERVGIYIRLGMGNGGGHY